MELCFILQVERFMWPCIHIQTHKCVFVCLNTCVLWMIHIYIYQGFSERFFSRSECIHVYIPNKHIHGYLYIHVYTSGVWNYFVLKIHWLAYIHRYMMYLYILMHAHMYVDPLTAIQICIHDACIYTHTYTYIYWFQGFAEIVLKICDAGTNVNVQVCVCMYVWSCIRMYQFLPRLNLSFPCIDVCQNVHLYASM